MADRAIGDLNFAPGTVDDSNTLFVVQQAGAAYKLSGHNFILALTSILDGHGGVKSITYDAPVSPSLTGTMTITLADDSTTTVSVTNGKGITSISKTGTSGLVDTYTISYNDGTTQNFTVTNGAKGDTGDAWYVWIRYAGQRPTSDSDIGTVPDDWIGIYSGTASTAPTSYTAYSWYEYKGEKGDTGTAASITQQSVTYQESSSGTVAPSGSWVENIPSVTPGNFLWTRTVLEFNDGTSVTSYSVSRYGIDGTGAVSTVNNIAPDTNGNIALPATGIPASDNQSVQAHLTSIESDIGDLQTDVGTLQSDMTTAQGQITTLNEFMGTALMMPQNTIPIPAEGSSVTIKMQGLSSVHRLNYWNFSASAENYPPVDLSWTTSADTCVITNNGGSTSESMKPIFVLPTIVAATTT